LPPCAPRLAALIRFALATGCRAREITGLDWNRVDVAQDCVPRSDEEWNAAGRGRRRVRRQGRREDIPILMNHYLRKFCQHHGRDITGFTGRAIDAMLSYEWPGNIREMENIIERGVILGTDGRAIDVSHLFTSGEQVESRMFGLGGDGSLAISENLDSGRSGLEEGEVNRVTKKVTNLLLGIGEDNDATSLDDIETLLLKGAVARAQGNLSAAARLLGITRPQLVYRMKSRGNHL
jgi:two-component system response regulator HydG